MQRKPDEKNTSSRNALVTLRVPTGGPIAPPASPKDRSHDTSSCWRDRGSSGERRRETIFSAAAGPSIPPPIASCAWAAAIGRWEPEPLEQARLRHCACAHRRSALLPAPDSAVRGATRNRGFHQPISPSRIEKPGSADVASASRGPCSTTDDHASPLGPVCTQVMRSLASTTQNSRTPWRA